MSDPLQDIIRRLSPLHVVMAHGLSPNEIERLHEDLVSLAVDIEQLEDRVAYLEIELENAEAGVEEHEHDVSKLIKPIVAARTAS
jgi:hypothetical protein